MESVNRVGQYCKPVVRFDDEPFVVAVQVIDLDLYSASHAINRWFFYKPRDCGLTLIDSPYSASGN